MQQVCRTLQNYSLVDTGLLVHWLVSPSCTEFSLVQLYIVALSEKMKYHSV